MDNVTMLTGLARVGAALPGFFLSVGTRLIATLGDGQVSVEEAEVLAADISDDVGDIKVKVRGLDIIDDDAQDHLARFVGRVVANVVKALKGPKAEAE